MSRPKYYGRLELPPGVVTMVTAILADYHRREEALRYGKITGDVLARYAEINDVIGRALCPIEAAFREDFLSDIAEGRGYGRSRAAGVMSKNAYYRRRHRLIHDVATGLFLYPE